MNRPASTDAPVPATAAPANTGPVFAGVLRPEVARHRAAIAAAPGSTPDFTRPEVTRVAQGAVFSTPPQHECVAPPGQPWREALMLIEQHLPFTRRALRAGDAVQVTGGPFTCLHVLNLGAVKTVSVGGNGREQVVDLHLKGDWIGFDGIAPGSYACDAYAMDTSEVWKLHYPTLLGAAASVPALMIALHAAMSRQLARDRERRVAHDTLSADARVADFVRLWAQSLAQRHLRTDQVALRLTRTEIGSYLGMTHESVSRAFTRLERAGLVRFEQQGRRNIAIPSVQALAEFVLCEVSRSEAGTLQ